METQPAKRLSRTLIVVRYVLPATLTIVGVALYFSDRNGAGGHGALGVIGAGLAAFLFAFLAKLSMSGDKHRDEDAEQGRFFDEHGYWPDEDPSAARGRSRVGTARD